MTIQEWINFWKDNQHEYVKDLVENVERITANDENSMDSIRGANDSDLSSENKEYEAFLTDPRRI